MAEILVTGIINSYVFLLPYAQFGFLICTLILIPLSFLDSMRGFVSVALFCFSYLLGLTTWFLGCALTLEIMGWLGLLLGMLIFGWGVVPLGIIGSFWVGLTSFGISLIVMSLFTYLFRFFALKLANEH
jgi:hypothetical protein